MNVPDSAHLDSRLQETEIKLAFLEKELDAYKDAVQDLHARLDRMEKAVKALRNSREPGESGAAGQEAGPGSPDAFAS